MRENQRHTKSLFKVPRDKSEREAGQSLLTIPGSAAHLLGSYLAHAGCGYLGLPLLAII